MQILSHANAKKKKKKKKASEFQTSHFHESFSSDIMAVKGLIAARQNVGSGIAQWIVTRV